MPEMDYSYTGHILRWVDGDTVDMRVTKTFDFGFKVKQTLEYEGRFRLITVDTPERGEPGYHEATDFCETWLPAGTTVETWTYKDPESFGRYLADLRFPETAGGKTSTSMSEMLLRHGQAVPYVRGK